MSNSSEDKSKLWGGRFSEATDAFVQAFTASVEFDQRMYRQDIEGSRAHASMLCKVGVLSAEDRDAILRGLDQVKQEIEAGKLNWSIEREDVLMNIEARLTEIIGDAGKRLHAGRSRNDQVTTGIRLYLREQIGFVICELRRLQTGLLDLAEKEADTIMPGFTHLQVAQPVTFGHHLLAWFEMLQRDAGRLQDCRTRLNVMPLGSAALAGNASVDRRGFAAVLMDLAERAETGVLEAHAGTVTTRIYVQRGAPISVEGGSLRDTLGRLLVRTGALSEQNYERVIQRMTENLIDNEHQRMGEVLIELGLMKPIDVYQALSRQAGEKIVEAFAASHVELAFDATPELPSAIEPLAVPPFPALLVECVKRHFGPDEQIALLTPIAGSRLRLRDPAPELRLSGDDARVAAAVGRANSVAAATP